MGKSLNSNRFTPTLNMLESRENPTTLSWTAGSGNDTIYIHDHGNGDVAFFVNGVGRNPAGGLWHNVTRFDLNTGGGNDKVYYFSYPGVRTVDMDLNVNLGSGNDYFLAEVHGDIGVNRTLDIDVNGGHGSDIMWVLAGEGTAQDGSQLTPIDIRAGAKLKIDLDGDAGNDVMGVLYTGENDGFLSMNFQGDSGTDTLHRHIDFWSNSNGGWTWSHSSVETKFTSLN